MPSIWSGIARAWPTIAAVLAAALGGIASDGSLVSAHPRLSVLIGAVLMVLANFTHSPAGPRATPDSIVAVQK